jgi:hypothetical protein
MLSVWYLILFQIYPVVHLHWHEGEGLETCFIAVEYNHADHVVHQDFHDAAKLPHALNAPESEFCGHAHLSVAAPEHAENCHHFHTKADFDHFFSKNSDSAKKLKSVDQVLVDCLCFADSENLEIVPPHALALFNVFYFSSIPNKSPPVC